MYTRHSIAGTNLVCLAGKELTNPQTNAFPRKSGLMVKITGQRSEGKGDAQ